MIEIQPDEEGVYLIRHQSKGAGTAAQSMAAPMRPDRVNEPEPEYAAMPINRILFGLLGRFDPGNLIVVALG